MKVWHNGYDWIAANTVEEAMAFYKEFTGCDPDEGDDWEEETNLTRKIIYEDEEDPADREETFAQALERGIKESEGKPFYLAGTEQ